MLITSVFGAAPRLLKRDRVSRAARVVWSRCALILRRSAGESVQGARIAPVRPLSSWLARLRPVGGSLRDRVMHSSLVPFEMRARIYWHKYRHTWIARRPDDFIGKLH